MSRFVADNIKKSKVFFRVDISCESSARQADDSHEITSLILSAKVVKKKKKTDIISNNFPHCLTCYYRGLIKDEYLVIILGYFFFYFSIKTYAVGTH